MNATDGSPSASEKLRRRIASVEDELRSLKAQLAQAEADEAEKTRADGTINGSSQAQDGSWRWPLQAEEYERYARQLVLPAVGVSGQLRLQAASVLIVGAGGLGCPAATYLAGAGIGHIGIVDGDVVETSNLHRQIGHATDRVGMHKADSLVAHMRRLNPRPRYTAHATHLTPANAAALVSSCDLVLDCTDHPAARYLVSDACVRAGKPLVSAAALRTDGQLAVLNWPVGAGPCYRCVFPRPPPPASQQSCAEGGILGPVVGIMGVLQALEAVRILVAGTDTDDDAPPPTLLLFSAADGRGRLNPPSVRSVRLRGRRPDCFACAAESPLSKLQSLKDVSSGSGGAWPDYVQFCGGGSAADRPRLKPEERVSVQEFLRVQQSQRKHWLLDVREKELYDMGSLDGACSVPFSKVQAAVSRRKRSAEEQSWPDWLPAEMESDGAPVYVVCRVGNDSQEVARQIKDLGLDRSGTRFIGDIQGGIQAWKAEIDSTMPFA